MGSRGRHYMSSNLLGAAVGGFSEYLGMVTGTRFLILLVLLFYLLSVLAVARMIRGNGQLNLTGAARP